jgi:hypothetical protein
MRAQYAIGLGLGQLKIVGNVALLFILAKYFVEIASYALFEACRLLLNIIQ